MKQVSSKKWIALSMECSSMVSVAAFGPRDPGSNPGWFAVSNSNLKLSFVNNTRQTFGFKLLVGPFNRKNVQFL